MNVTINPAVTETKVVEVKPRTITFTLNEQEAGILASIMGKVGGIGPNREITNRFYNEATDFLREDYYLKYKHLVYGDLTICETEV
jgi:hypothetical protein